MMTLDPETFDPDALEVQDLSKYIEKEMMVY
jgi:hypothetical protein